MRPITVPAYLRDILAMTDSEKVALIRANYAQMLTSEPLASVVIPAHNEEKNILNVLVSLTSNRAAFPFEVIVVNNNSIDRTEELVRSTGLKCINESKKGVVAARTAGLMSAKGKYILNADADSIYPPDWLQAMVPPLDNDSNVALTYGRFAFIPSGSQSRVVYFLYESAADVLRLVKKAFKEEGMNVYGCNSGFRKQQCLAVNTYEHPPGANEDGWLAVKLRDKGFGRLHFVSSNKALVWTVDRHLQNDGGLLKAFTMRLKGAFGLS
jgi:glycosyltransferase involved in cell wall biosynthesis